MNRGVPTVTYKLTAVVDLADEHDYMTIEGNDAESDGANPRSTTRATVRTPLLAPEESILRQSMRRNLPPIHNYEEMQYAPLVRPISNWQHLFVRQYPNACLNPTGIFVLNTHNRWEEISPLAAYVCAFIVVTKYLARLDNITNDQILETARASDIDVEILSNSDNLPAQMIALVLQGMITVDHSAEECVTPPIAVAAISVTSFIYLLTTAMQILYDFCQRRRALRKHEVPATSARAAITTHPDGTERSLVPIMTVSALLAAGGFAFQFMRALSDSLYHPVPYATCLEEAQNSTTPVRYNRAICQSVTLLNELSNSASELVSDLRYVIAALLIGLFIIKLLQNLCKPNNGAQANPGLGHG